MLTQNMHVHNFHLATNNLKPQGLLYISYQCLPLRLRAITNCVRKSSPAFTGAAHRKNGETLRLLHSRPLHLCQCLHIKLHVSKCFHQWAPPYRIRQPHTLIFETANIIAFSQAKCLYVFSKDAIFCSDKAEYGTFWHRLCVQTTPFPV